MWLADFQQGCQDHSKGERTAFSTYGDGTTGYPQKKKNEVGLPHTMCKKIHSKWIKDLNIRAKTIRRLEENTGVNLYNLELGNAFSYMIPKAHAPKKKN